MNYPRIDKRYVCEQEIIDVRKIQLEKEKKMRRNNKLDMEKTGGSRDELNEIEREKLK